MKVLCFADTRFPIERANGVQTMATCHALAMRGHTVTLVVRPDSTDPPRDPFEFYGLPPIDALRVQTVAAGAGAGVNTRRARFLLAAAQIVVTNRDAIVFTRDLGLASWLVRMPRLQRLPLVYESHGVADIVAAEMPVLLGKPELTPSGRKLERLARRERRVWSRAAAYVTLTQTLADELSARFGSRPFVYVVPDAAARAERAPAHDDPFVAGYAGHLYPWKGVDVFVRALAAAPGIRGLIVGGHPGESDVARVQQLVMSLGLADRVTITGLVAPDEVRARLAAASVLVLPNTASAISARYTSPLKLFEYLSLGRPIVASDFPAIREVLEDRKTALLVPPGDAAALASALMELRGDEQLQRSLADAAASLAPSYTWDQRAKRLEAALQTAESA